MLCDCCDFPACEHRLTLAEFVQKYGVRARVEPADRNPHMDGTGMDHWKVVLYQKSAPGTPRARQWTSHFSKGPGHRGAEPTAEEVLNCAALDSTGVENADSFEEWCAEYGYDTDSRKAERAYRATKSATGGLKQFLGAEAYDVLLYHTEGL